MHLRDAKRRAKAKNCEKIAVGDHVYLYAGGKHHQKGEARYKHKAELETGEPLKRDKPSVISTTKYRVSCMKLCRKYKEPTEQVPSHEEQPSLLAVESDEVYLPDSSSNSEIVEEFEQVPIFSRKNRVN